MHSDPTEIIHGSETGKDTILFGALSELRYFPEQNGITAAAKSEDFRVYGHVRELFGLDRYRFTLQDFSKLGFDLFVLFGAQL